MSKRRLSKKQMDFIKAYLETGNGTKAALRAYNTDDYMTAHSIAVENLQKPAIRDRIDKMMGEASFDDSYLKSIHEKLLEDDNSSVAIKALDMAYKIKGVYIQAQIDATKKKDSKGRRKIIYEDVVHYWEEAKREEKLHNEQN